MGCYLQLSFNLHLHCPSFSPHKRYWTCGVAATASCCSCPDSYCLLLTRFYILVETGDISVLGPCRYNMMGKNLVLSVDIWRYIARYRSILHFLFFEIFFLNKLGLGLPFLLFLSFGWNFPYLLFMVLCNILKTWF